MGKNNDVFENIKYGCRKIFGFLLLSVLLGLIVLWAYKAYISDGLVTQTFLIFLNVMQVLAGLFLVIFILLLIPFKISWLSSLL